MAIDKNTVPNIDDSDPADYPNGQIRDNDGSDNGTPVNRAVFSDMFELLAKLMRMAGIPYNGQFDNESSGYQYVQALQGLAGKNDIKQHVTSQNVVIGGTNTNVLFVPVKIETLQPDEVLICQAFEAYNAQTQLKGLTADTYKTIAVADSFAQYDVLLIVNEPGGISIIRLISGINLNFRVNELGYLKAASQGQENVGALNTVATTPLTNLTAFTRRVIGADSDPYVATEAHNGLLSAADKVKIDTFADPVRNRGWFTGLDPGGTPIGTSLARSGGVVSAVVTSAATGDSVVLVTIANPMTGQNYFVRSFVESISNIGLNNDMNCPVFVPVTPTTFQWSISETVGGVQNLKIHIEVVQIS